MREPPFQSKFLASPPIFLGLWGLTFWSVWQWTRHEDAWPIAVSFGLLAIAATNAEEQVRRYRNWKREWDAISGVPPRPRKWPVYLGMLLGVPVFAALVSVGQREGALAVAVVVASPLALMAVIGLALIGIGKLMQRSTRARKVVPVRVAVRRALVRVPSLDAAYRNLPPYCQTLLKGQP